VSLHSAANGHGVIAQTLFELLNPRERSRRNEDQDTTGGGNRDLAPARCRRRALWLAPLGGAVEDPDERPAPLGLVGMTQEQKLRLSVAYVKGFDPQPDPPGCRLKVGFVDGDGSVIGDPEEFELRPGAARSFDFVLQAPPIPDRFYVRPVAVDLAPKEACPAVVTGELLDREGVNAIIVYDSVAFTDPWLAM
jgi:hypothetical protein